MNKKYILKKDDECVFCIINDQKPQQEEWERVFGIEKGFGLTAELVGNQVIVKDYYRADILASFPVIKVLNTEEQTVYQLTHIEE